jgi:hypothetical protein
MPARHIVLGAAFVTLTAAPAAALPCRGGATPMARVELVFGTGGVRPSAWAAFLTREITPRFPDGLTVLAAYGQWRPPAGGVSHEPSKILLIWYLPSATADAKIEAIRDAYKVRFHQQSVLRADGEDCVSF